MRPRKNQIEAGYVRGNERRSRRGEGGVASEASGKGKVHEKK